MSDDLVREIKTNHQSMEESLHQIKQKIRSYKTTKPLLGVLSKVLLEYFERQNTILPEFLIKFYAHDRASLKMIEFLRYDLRDLEVKYLDFFHLYLSDVGNRYERSFLGDFSKFSESIVTRIQSDRILLFPLLEKITKSTQQNTILPIA